MVGTKSRAALILGLLALAGCGGAGNRIVVGSKNFTEQLILGEIAAQHLERRLGQPVERRLNLGGTLLAHQALTSGAIDVYPEYTGTALTSVLNLPASGNSRSVFDTVSREYANRYHLSWIAPLGFNNSFAMVVRGDESLKTLSEASSRTRPWRLGVGYEFVKRPDGLAGLVRAYGLKQEGPPREMDLGLLYQALTSGQVDMAAGSATDGLIEQLKLKVLEDDRGYFPPYEAAFITRREELRKPLEELSGKLSTERMRRLNFEVDGRHRRPEEVAREFLDAFSQPR